MIAQFRAFAKSWYAAVLIGLLIVSFAFLGVKDVFGGRLSNDVVQAGPRHVGPADFKRDFENYRKQIEQRAGQPVSQAVAIQNHLDTRVAQEIGAREAFAALMDRMGIRASDKLIQQQLEKNPEFFDRISGRFDRQQYLRLLNQFGFTWQRYEALMRDDIAQTQVGAALATGLRVPRAYSALGAVYMLERRDVAYFAIEPKNVTQPALPTDAQLTTFMQENATPLTRPEFRVLTVVKFAPDVGGAATPISDADLKKRFEFRKDTLSKPETRAVVQIPVKDAKSAQAISARLESGEDPRLVAKSIGVEAILYADKPKSAIVDPKIADKAFSMKEGEQAVVQGNLSLAVVRLDKITPGHTATIEELRPQLEAELHKDAASEKVYALSQKYDDAHSGGSSLAEAAKKTGVPTVAIGPVSQQGVDPAGRPVAGISPKLIQSAFALPAGGESEVQEAGNGEYFAVRVEKIIPKSLPPLAEVKPQLIKVWMNREMVKTLQAKGAELTARIKKGETLDAVAASIGQPVSHAKDLSRQTAGQQKDLSQEALGQTFSVGPGEVFTAQSAKSFGLIVGKVEKVAAPEGPTMVQFTEGARPSMSKSIFQELGNSARTAARNKMKVTIYPEQARLALGLEATDTKGKVKGKAQ